MDTIKYNLGRIEIAVPKAMALVGADYKVLGVVVKKEHAPDPKADSGKPVSDRFPSLWSEEMARAVEHTKPGFAGDQRPAPREIIVSDSIRAVVSGGMGDCDVRALGKYGDHYAVFAIRTLFGREGPDVDAITRVAKAYQPTTPDALHGPGRPGMFHTRSGFVALPPTEEPEEESIEAMFQDPQGYKLKVESTTKAEPQEPPGLMKKLSGALGGWASDLKVVRKRECVVDGLEGVEVVVIDNDGSLQGMWQHEPFEPSPPSFAGKITLEAPDANEVAFFERWDTVLGSLKRHE